MGGLGLLATLMPARSPAQTCQPHLQAKLALSSPTSEVMPRPLVDLFVLWRVARYLPLCSAADFCKFSAMLFSRTCPCCSAFVQHSCCNFLHDTATCGNWSE